MTRILIVDDSPSTRFVLKATLQNAGYEVVEIDSCSEALSLAQKDRFDLIITDLNLKNMTGNEFTKELRKLPEYMRIPILVLTTDDRPEQKQEGKACGVTGWIVKPFNPPSLLDLLKKLIT